MPSLERDEDVFILECESVPLSASGASGDFGRESKLVLSFYGSTLSTPLIVSPASTTTEQPKDPEQWPLLGDVLPPPGGWSRAAGGSGGVGVGSGVGVPSGLSATEILPLASDPFWCRLRATVFAIFWVVMAVLLACVAVIVVKDTQHCSPPAQTLNVSLPLAAMPVLQALSASRY